MVSQHDGWPVCSLWKSLEVAGFALLDVRYRYVIRKAQQDCFTGLARPNKLDQHGLADRLIDCAALSGFYFVKKLVKMNPLT